MTELTQVEINQAATNDPFLANVKVTIGDRTFPILDLEYDDYVLFLSHLQPLIKGVFGKLASLSNMSNLDVDQINGASLIEYCADALPEMVRIVCKQSDPTITADEVKKLAKNPCKMASIVLEQVQQNRMISDFTDFFVQILPLMKVATEATAPVPVKKSRIKAIR